MAVNLRLRYLICVLLTLLLVYFATNKLYGNKERTVNVKLLEDNKELSVVPLKSNPFNASLVMYSIELPVVPRKVYYDNRTFKGKPRNLVCILAEVRDLVLTGEITIVSCELNGYSTQKVKVVEDPIANWIKMRYSNKYKYYYAMIKCSGIPYEAITNGSIAHVLYQTKGEDVVIQVEVDQPLYLPPASQRNSAPTKGDHSIVVCATMYGHPPRFNEWLVYQKAIGMDQVHLNVDETFFVNATSVYPFLKDALGSGFVSMEVWETNPDVFYYSQSLKYQDCVMRYQGVFDLAIMIDYDDFVIPLLPDEKDINYYVKRSFIDGRTGSVMIAWKEFPCEVDQNLLAKLKSGNVTESLKSHFCQRRQERKVINKLSAVELVSVHSSISLPGFLSIESGTLPLYIAHIRPQREKCVHEI